jgi:[ribosomal protein S5]-alanine N-acetyltransferase
MDYFLRSPRLGFRCWTPEDLSLAEQLWGDPQVTLLIGGPFTEEMIRGRLASEIASMQGHRVQYWPIFLLEGDQHVGCAGLRPYQIEDGVYELGFHLRGLYAGQGLATEVGRAVIDYAFDEFNASALFAGHHPANEASRRVLLKLGFIYTRDQLYAPTGLLHPSYLLRIR